MLDELDRYFEEFEKSLEDAIRSSVNTGQKAFSKPVVAGMAMGLGPRASPRSTSSATTWSGPTDSGRPSTSRSWTRRRET